MLRRIVNQVAVSDGGLGCSRYNKIGERDGNNLASSEEEFHLVVKAE